MALKPAKGVWPRIRRALYWTHRWLGVGGALLFVVWFVSGVVMMYVGFPSLSDEERLAGLPVLRLDDAPVSPVQALAALPAEAREPVPRRIGLEMLAAGPQAGPVWRIVDARGRRHAISALSGEPLAPTDAATAEAIARAFSGQAGARWAETLERDQWTVPNGLNPLRPLHRIELGDAAGTELYVSAVSGEVVRDTTRNERFWNWLGAVPHWIYFTPLRADPPLWREGVLWLSGAGIVSALTGLVIGVMRLRLRGRYRNGRVTPYGGWFAWHHVAGLLGGLFICSWIASGWLSMDPNGWFQSELPTPQALARYHGTAGGTASGNGPEAGGADGGGPGATAALAAAAWPPPGLDAGSGPREGQLVFFDGRPLWQWRDARAAIRVVDAARGEPPHIGRGQIAAAAARYRPEARVERLLWLEQADAHWYGHHRSRVLPVWRVVYDDPAGHWLHIDPASGQILGFSDSASRTRRWLFNAAHSLDFPWLIAHRPAWDLVLGSLSILGAVVSVSGVVLGWRRLRRSVPSSPARPARPPSAASAARPVSPQLKSEGESP